MKSLFSSCLAFLCTWPLWCVAQIYQEQPFKSADGTDLKAWLIHPEGLAAEQQRPVVLALHGCGGLYATLGVRRGQLNARHDGMAQLLRAQGYSVMFPDSFNARGEQSICTQKMRARKIKQSHRRDDVTGALTWLGTQKWVDVNKIAVLGWSHGGSAVLAATNDNELGVSIRPVQPSMAIAFYPGCSDALRTGYQPKVPLLMLLGELDDWTPAAPCIELAKRVKAKAVVYPESHHDFDNPVGSVKLREEVPNGVHPGRGVHAGRNPVTGPQAWQMVVDTLAASWVVDVQH
jgi:dienelactone hydrolase